LGGILPFGAIFIELYFIMNSLWFNRYLSFSLVVTVTHNCFFDCSIYYVFGFLFLVFSILVVTCCEVTILLCYFHLCAEDYHWWWRSFFTAGCTAFYVFIYSIM